MIREKGGRRQPRYFRLKDQASERLVRLLETRTEGPKKIDGLKEGLYDKMLRLCEEMDLAIFSINICLWAEI